MSPVTAREWLDHVLDPGWSLLFEDVVGGDPLLFPGYAEQLRAAREKTGCTESVLVADGMLDGRHAMAISFEFGFLGGSMGTAAGERICRAFERAAEQRIPVIALTASGGARMQEGMLALAQMPATLAARQKLADAKRMFICYLRNPTTGGVYASFASSADLLWAEPGATIGFAGPRVAETVTGEPLPEGSHTAESAYDSSLIDELIEPDALRARLDELLEPLSWGYAGTGHTVEEPRGRHSMDAWDQVSFARDPHRPTGSDFAPKGTHIRRGGADPTTVVTLTGNDWLAFKRPVFIAQNRYAETGRTRPEGYRRIRQAIDLAVRLERPIVTLIDTPGADPSASSEADGVARQISATFEALLAAPVPTVAICVGEGGSGGALALAACDVFMIMEHAIFTVISPEGAASILRRDDVSVVAAELQLTAHDLKDTGLADFVIAEPEGGAHVDPRRAVSSVQAAVMAALESLFVRAEQADSADVLPPPEIPTARRLERWRVLR
ncbi:MAG: carboxyl transferase domain-containing protein [Actinomycetota bacterium]